MASSTGRLIGKGAFGSVYDLGDGRVEKRINHNRQGGVARDFIQELGIMKKMNGTPYIMPILDFSVEDVYSRIVMPRAVQNLLDHVRDRLMIWNHEQKIDIIRQIALGVRSLHHHNVLHLDLKPQNVLVMEDGTCLLADFGLSRDHACTTDLNNTKGTINYMAPEVMSSRLYSFPADVWSLGAITVLLFTRQTLYRVGGVNLPVDNIFRRARTDMITFTIRDKIQAIEDVDIRAIVSACLVENPLNRANIDEILSMRPLSVDSVPRPSCRDMISEYLNTTRHTTGMERLIMMASYYQYGSITPEAYSVAITLADVARINDPNEFIAALMIAFSYVDSKEMHGGGNLNIIRDILNRLDGFIHYTTPIHLLKDEVFTSSSEVMIALLRMMMGDTISSEDEIIEIANRVIRDPSQPERVRSVLRIMVK